jgi:hypothetical protein
MNNARTMQLSFEKEKNIKASIITLLICLLLFVTFFFLQWTLPQIPIPEAGEGIEVNLGNGETGMGDIAPEIPGQPSPTQDQTNPSPPPSNQLVNTKEIQADETGDEAVNLVKKTAAKPVEKTTVEVKPTLKKTETVATPVPAPPKPKALFKGGAAAEAIYRPSRSTADDGWSDEAAAMERVSKAARFQPGDRAGDPSTPQPRRKGVRLAEAPVSSERSDETDEADEDEEGDDQSFESVGGRPPNPVPLSSEMA